MKITRNLFKIALITLLTISCSSDDDSNSENNIVFGTIQLSGEDTSVLGNSLIVGNIQADAQGTTGTLGSIVLLDENTTIEDGELNLGDLLNGFVIVAAQFDIEANDNEGKAISMTILKNGEEYSYVCSTPPTAGSENTDCGTGFSVDKIAKQVVFNETTVINVDSGTILTMDGTINYN